MASIEMINDELFVCAEIHQNLFSCRRSLDASTEEERARLEVVGRFHAGEMINKITQGSLVMNLPDPDVTHKVTPTHVFGTSM
jgi:DNA damage-binding protein 1